MTDAISIAVALGAGLSTIWGYYVTVIVGLAAVIGALAAARIPLDTNVRITVTIAVVLFMAVNLISLKTTTSHLNRVIDYISSKDSELGSIVGRMRFSYSMLLIQPIGVILLLIWLWRY